MQALVYRGRRAIALEEVPEPTPGPGELLLEVTDSLLSQSVVDFNIEGHFADPLGPHPLTGIGSGYVMGQQFGGVVTAVGEGGDESLVDRQVAVAPGFGCGECSYCASGQTNYCAQYAYYGLLGAHGGHAPLCVVNQDAAIPVPHRDFGPAFEGLLVSHSLLRKSKPWMRDGEPVCILGAGPIGIGTAILLRDLFGAAAVLYEVLPGRRERARSIGLEVADPAESTTCFSLVLDCAGTNPETGGSAIAAGLPRVAKGGALMFVGTYLHDTTIAPFDLLLREVTIGSSFAYSEEDVRDLAARLGEIDLGLGALYEPITLSQAAGEGLMRGEVERDGFTALVVRS